MTNSQNKSDVYDCYQVKIQVKLTEEDSCLYDRFGKDLFSVKKDVDNSPCDDFDDNKDTPDGEPFITHIEIDKCDCTKAIFTLYVCLPVDDACAKVDHDENSFATYFKPCKFMVVSGTSSQRREVVTFEVHPLRGNVVSSGVVDKCCTYETMRVCKYVKRKKSTSGLIGSDPATFAPVPSITNSFFEFSNDAKESLCYGRDANLMRIIFPMTKDLKCLAPRLGIGGTLIDSVAGAVCKIRVRLVTTDPCPFDYPALLTYDIESCTVCLEVEDNPLIIEPLLDGYTNKFGKLGCDYFIDDNIAGSVVPDVAGNLFSYLALSRKINVMGVDKCSETVLFSFQICVYTQESIIVNDCGSNVNYVPSCPKTDHTFNNLTIAQISSKVDGYRVKSTVGEYCYEFAKLHEGSEGPTTTSKPL